ncbi:MAG: UvrD-helicase domain-containing protein [Verrucomicrobiales bacterium]|nr:UvrD-helicase domain-containing protein [Verrucomicrobiales bacterium]
MEPSRTQNDSLTPSQRQAVAARGNVLVMAGAGTGKTKTLVARCLDCLERERASLDKLLIVTFTEAAAAEMRQRLRRAIEARTQDASLNSQPLAASKQGEDGSTLNFWRSQLALFDIAHIGTLHSFCLRLVREHFHELGLDPQLAILDEGEARQLANETLDEQFQAHYAGEDEFSIAVKNLIQIHGGGRDEKIRALILRLHNYSQTRPAAAGWLAEQIQKFSAAEPADWRHLLLTAIEDWRNEWLPVLENLKGGNEKAAELAGILARLESGVASSLRLDHIGAQRRRYTREMEAEVLEQIISADGNWPAKRKTVLRKPLEDLFDEAAFLAALAPVKNGTDPLTEDWNWVRGHMETLLRLAEEFAGKFSDRKRADGVLDFHDLEQFALKLLWDFAADKPTATAETWRNKLSFVFVDEYQDINAAQDKIIAALSRNAFSPSPRPSGERAGVRGAELANNLPPHPDPLLLLGGEGEGKNAPVGNRFLVGDVKQSIYRFRLADPKIFRDYSKIWHGENGRVIPLSENFRSRESLLNFVNSVFAPLMRKELGGVEYDEEAQLKFGSPETRPGFSVAKDASPRTELLLRLKAGRNESSEPDEESGADEPADLGETEKEARLLAARLKELRAEKHEIWDDKDKIFRAVEWRDMAVLLRAMSGKSEIYAMEFEHAGVPLVIARGGFYDSSEIADLLSLLQLLDNPLQDVPCIAVLRSPLVGLSLDELAAIRLTVSREHFWTALNAIQNEKLKIKNAAAGKVSKFLERFARWRKLARQASLSRCLEQVLAETHYDDWLKSRSRGLQRHANVGRFLNLAQKFDQFQRQGLFRFLKFIEAQREAEAEPEVAATPDENAVRLMSIHQSKGLEFPVVAIADLAKPFNTQDLRGEIIFDEEFGLCPKVKPPHTGRRYPSLPHWLAQRHQRREQAGEELRLLYVAMTRARDTLILTGSVSEKKWTEQWQETGTVTEQKILAAKSYADWLGIWFAQRQVQNSKFKIQNEKEGETPLLRWRIVEDVELGGDPVRSSRGDEAQTKEKPEPPHVGCYGDTTALDEATVKKLRAVLGWVYPQQAATERAAKSSVTALRRQASDELDDEAEPVFNFQFSGRRLARVPAPPGQNPKSEIRNPKLNAADAGTAHHKFLQHVSLEKTGGVTALEAEALRLERQRVLSADERGALNLKAVAAFWNSDAGQKIRQQATSVKRELAFTAKFRLNELDKLVGSSRCDDGTPQHGILASNEFVVVQGVADLVVLLPREIWLVDFKTDEAGAGDLPAKIKLYSPQLKLYASALGRIYSKPVTNCWLHFLSAQRTESVDCAD